MLDNAYNKNSDNPKARHSNGNGVAKNITNNKEIEGEGPLVPSGTDTPRFVAPTHAGVDILKLLSELEDVVENTKRLPAGIMVRFDDEKFHYIIMKIRANLPEEMKRASKLARDSERIVEEAKENAERLLTEARKSAQSQLESGKRDAELRYEEMLREARKAEEEAKQEVKRLHEALCAQREEILTAAEEEATRRVSEHAITAQAEAEAQAIQARAEQEASRLYYAAEQEANAVRQGADDYAREVLIKLESVLDKAVTQVQHGRQLLER